MVRSQTIYKLLTQAATFNVNATHALILLVTVLVSIHFLIRIMKIFNSFCEEPLLSLTHLRGTDQITLQFGTLKCKAKLQRNVIYMSPDIWHDSSDDHTGKWASKYDK